MTTYIYEIDDGFTTRYEYIIAKDRTKAREILNKRISTCDFVFLISETKTTFLDLVEAIISKVLFIK